MKALTRIEEKACAIGFDLFGAAPVIRSPHADTFRHWLDRGYSAEMSWMGAHPDKRENPSRILADARSVVTVGVSYFVREPPPELWNDPLRGRIARYAWGPDYHDVVLPMLRELAEFIAAESNTPVSYRAYVDTGPVLERDVAEQAAMGFVGKNTMLINSEFGSLIFLGEIITSAEITENGRRKTEDGNNDCGNCKRCLNACPTHAFPEPYLLDARRCISYQTIENKGSIPEEIRVAMGNWIFGCDECQSVCPYVRKFSKPSRKPFLKFEPETCVPLLTDLLQLDAGAFKERFRGTPIIRSKRRGLLRNAAVALGNSGDLSVLPVLEQARHDQEPLVREHAEWAIQRLAPAG